MNVWLTVLLCASVMSFGWIIRGHIIGGQKGAALPGALLGLALAFTSNNPSVAAAYLQYAAAGAIGFSIGGRMTYGQTLGFSHGPPSERRIFWGLLGCFVKGSVWIGLGALIIGLLTGMVAYTFRDYIFICLLAFGFYGLGLRLLNRPWTRAHKKPLVNFSKTRVESYGGLWFAWLAVLCYVFYVHGDWFAAGLSLFGWIGGGLGFSIGQAIQSRALIKNKQSKLSKWINYWTVMESTFGAVAGACVGLGWWWLKTYVDEVSLISKTDVSIADGGWTAALWIGAIIIFELIFQFGIKRQSRKPIFTPVAAGANDALSGLLYRWIPLYFVMFGSVLWSGLYALMLLASFCLRRIVTRLYDKKRRNGWVSFVAITLLAAMAAVVIWADISNRMLLSFLLIYHWVLMVINSSLLIHPISEKDANQNISRKWLDAYGSEIPVFALSFVQMIICILILW